MGLTPLVHARHFAQNELRYHAGIPGPVGSTQCGREIKSSEFGFKIVDVYPRSQGTVVGTLAKVQTRNMKRDGFKTQYGWDVHDVRAPDVVHEPLVGAIPQLSWHNLVATVKQGVPKGGSHALPRGGNTPRVVDVIDDKGGYPWFDPQGFQDVANRPVSLRGANGRPVQPNPIPFFYEKQARSKEGPQQRGGGGGGGGGKQIVANAPVPQTVDRFTQMEETANKLEQVLDRAPEALNPAQSGGLKQAEYTSFINELKRFIKEQLQQTVKAMKAEAGDRAKDAENVTQRLTPAETLGFIRHTQGQVERVVQKFEKKIGEMPSQADDRVDEVVDLLNQVDDRLKERLEVFARAASKGMASTQEKADKAARFTLDAVQELDQHVNQNLGTGVQLLSRQQRNLMETITATVEKEITRLGNVHLNVGGHTALLEDMKNKLQYLLLLVNAGQLENTFMTTKSLQDQGTRIETYLATLNRWINENVGPQQEVLLDISALLQQMANDGRAAAEEQATSSGTNAVQEPLSAVTATVPDPYGQSSTTLHGGNAPASASSFPGAPAPHVVAGLPGAYTDDAEPMEGLFGERRAWTEPPTPVEGWSEPPSPAPMDVDTDPALAADLRKALSEYESSRSSRTSSSPQMAQPFGTGLPPHLQAAYTNPVYNRPPSPQPPTTDVPTVNLMGVLPAGHSDNDTYYSFISTAEGARIPAYVTIPSGTAGVPAGTYRLSLLPRTELYDNGQEARTVVLKRVHNHRGFAAPVRLGTTFGHEQWIRLLQRFKANVAGRKTAGKGKGVDRGPSSQAGPSGPAPRRSTRAAAIASRKKTAVVYRSDGSEMGSSDFSSSGSSNTSPTQAAGRPASRGRAHGP